MKNLYEKEIGKGKKLEKELEGFKKWLGNVCGVRKVIEGCESVLMEQVTNRI